MRDFVWSYDNCFSNLPSLKHVYLLNENPVDFGGSFYENVNPDHDYFTSTLSPQATVPDGCNIYVPGGVKASCGGGVLGEMWMYELDKVNGRVKIEPLIEGLVIDDVVINGNHNEVRATAIYEYDKESANNLDIVVEFTLHERQQMSTHYDAEFNAAIPSTDLSKVSEIVSSSDDVTLFIGEATQLTATVLSESAANKTLVWSSSNEGVATVDADGLVTAVSLGRATITASCGEISASCEVTVLPVLIESIVIAPESWSGDVGETMQLTATVLPEDATDKTVTWMSSNEAVATVDDTGLVTMLKSGSCVITAEAGDGSGVKAQCTVTGLSGIDAIFADSDAEVDVYGIDGTLLTRGCDKVALQQLVPGAYILRRGERVVKTIVK